ncbi:LysR family transcriptional regulator [Roseivivax sp. GX 12232]|uniref:LysR family transcriptional regulator n=1 Tax=Roseivivax sp. GX 12232 TaxID=2900547 RepID=UPI001E582778|nr:LysR family transcriptional regulator [Roseivivax sp. GX 12232]MCE0504208.1 LysR family transcriptional regulator [Roseivivax sp. GX 12232]
MLNATWLETFTALCEAGHFTRAAERLGMTQPGVTQHVQKLEAQVGQALISRSGKSFSLTPAGEALREMGLARRAEEAALAERIGEDAPDRGEVRIACSGSFAMLLHPRLIAHMAGAPRLLVALEAAPQARVREGVLARRFDLGICESAPEHPRLTAREIGMDELCLLVPGDSPIGREGPVDLEALDALGMVAHPDGFAHADTLFGLNFPESYRGADRLRLRCSNNQIGQIPAPVAAGLGYTLLPRSGYDTYPERARIRIAPLPRRHRQPLWLVAERGRRPPARVESVARVVEDAAASLGEG